MPPSTIALAGVCCTMMLAHADIRLDCAYNHVDVGGQYAWSEGAPGLADFAKTDRRAGTLKVYVRNDGRAPVKVEATHLNGSELEGLRNSERHEVIWWRTWPTPVPPGAHAEVSVRLRYPLESDASVTLKAGEQTLEVPVAAEPPAFRIETTAWGDGGREVTIVAQQLRREQTRIEKVVLDGEDVTARAHLLAPEFLGGICPIELRLDEPLVVGSFHTYKLVAANGDAVACTLRTLDEFMRLGMYGAGDLEQNVKLGLNCAAHFRALDKEALGRYALFGQRSAFHVGGDGPSAEVRGHPAVHGYLLHDEPDCWDYSAKEWPAGMRLGFHGPDIAQATQRCVEVDPVKPVMVTLDLTFKPANYYVYAQIPDIVAPDCYPLSIGVPLAWVREVTTACRQAAGPRRVEAIPQVDFEDRKKQDMKFRRPPFAREVIIQYLYALGAGARGFSGWEWFDEKSDFATFYGAPNFPDVLNAVGHVFRRFDLLTPLILKAHPTDLATCAAEKVWVKTLVCGGEALLLVVVNDDYASLPTDFVQHAKQNVELSLPGIPWMNPAYAAVVQDGVLEPLALRSGAKGTSLVLSELETGAIVLIAADEETASELLQRHERKQQEAAKALFRGFRSGADEGAREEEKERYLLGRFDEYVVSLSKPLHAYGVEKTGFWNPSEQRYEGIEWWTENTPRGGEWKVTIPAERAGKKHRVYFQRERWWGGGYLRIEVEGPDGKLLQERDRPTWAGRIPNFTVTFPSAGDYTIRVLQAGEGKPGGRLAKDLLVVPADEPLPSAAW